MSQNTTIKPQHRIPAPIAVMFASLLTFSPLSAQLIPIRTVPVASGDQFLTVPSETLGMAGTTIAVDDSVADLWSNPAKGVFIDEPVIIGAPTFFGVSDEGGGGKTFPFTGLLRDGDWFGG
ncbi:MAG: hypothetical protein F4020_06900, partial [Gammaproteobacteria bacterium]|nr:hypothetical protein [Gammaproteobacteria bacterium]